ncbi:peroxisomal membrane protein PEX14-like [Homalodisca vitripennis]|uniref:peroxisomal membrane protein PEX14-like n=1 Tax=Homalodisca vitripennis TaxID=197043 RepID=UPI001EEA443E|nr:peroxisomal membrane protein PEX14-like [Homalodisca vitripennis]
MGNPDSDSHNEDNENIKNKDVDKDFQPREALISKAVLFLTNKKLVQQDPHHLRMFLLKKGLTEDEASMAFQRAEVIKSQSVQAEYSQSLVHPQLPPPLLPPAPVTSFWSTVHNIITTVTSIGGILYALYWLWKTYISPWLFGRKPKKKPIEASLSDLEAAVGNCVTDIQIIRTSLDTLAEQKAAELTQGVVVSRIQEVKSEIGSLKALLLNRSQFPATPAPLGIPAWQLRGEDSTHIEPREREEGGSGGSGSPANTNGSDSSLEIVKDPNNP